MREYVDLDVETPIRTEAGIWDYNYQTRKYILHSKSKEKKEDG